MVHHRPHQYKILLVHRLIFRQLSVVSSTSNGTETFTYFDDFSTNTTDNYIPYRQNNNGNFFLVWDSAREVIWLNATATFGECSWIVENNTWGTNYAIRSRTNMTRFTISGIGFFTLETNNDTNTNFVVYEGNSEIVNIRSNDGGVTWGTPLQSLSLNQYATIEIATTNNSIYLTRANNLTWFSFSESDSGSIKASLGSRPQNTGWPQGEWDWWFVRKFQDPEPTAFFSEEQFIPNVTTTTTTTTSTTTTTTTPPSNITGGYFLDITQFLEHECLNNLTLRSSGVINSNPTTIEVNCTYGCDQDINQCKQSPFEIYGITIVIFIIFLAVFLGLRRYLR